ncbi:SIS domain-containing protein [Clostridium neuense]|uniref:SIS domain-containing protein n=1 Tax=Clostridium neuense TaxID=1728934 RepID=A0ABW8TAF8_9CLOT
MSLRNFNLEKYLKNGKTTYAQRENIEKLADELTKEGFENIVVLGIGGTWAEWYPVVEYCKHLSDFPIYLENAGEFLVKQNMSYLTKKSLVLTASASGNTKEILEASKLCISKGIPVFGFTKDETTPLAKLLTKAIYNPCGDCEDSYLMYFMLALRLYKNLGYFSQYDRWADQMKNLHTNLIRIREEFEPRAAEIARKYSKEPYTMFVGSGVLWGETYLFSMCILEEMQWVRTKAVKSSDFFHGPLELVEKDLPVFLVMGEDEYRQLDERVERFAKKFTDKLEVFDTKDFQLTDIDDEFRVIVSPMIATAILTERLAAHYELNTGHSLEFRRYYRQFEY